MTKRRVGELSTLVVGATFFVCSLLILAELGSKQTCAVDWKWLGCALNAHENLAGGMIGGCITPIAAWIAWNAVQDQINAHRALALADREEAERVLNVHLAEVAEGLAAAWRMLEETEGATSEVMTRVRSAVAYAVERSTSPERIKAYWQMLELLAWEKRLNFGRLLDGLDHLSAFSDEDKLGDCREFLDAVRRLSDDFQMCMPGTQEYFEGLWVPWAKADTFGDAVRRVGGFH